VVTALGAVRQLLPSDGFWHGGNANALTSMTQAMTQSAQPHWIAWLALHGGDVAGTLGGGSNLLIVLWLAITAVGLWLAPVRSWNWPVWSLAIFSVLFWFIAEDAAFFGGLATDFNSLIPLAALALCASPRVASLPALSRKLPAELRSLSGAVIASFACGMVIYSIVTMGWAVWQPAETTFYVAANGLASSVDSHAPGFHLTDQHGQPFSLGEHQGRYTLLTFLDPVCWTDCPLLAAQMQQVGAALGPNAKVDYVAVAANPLHETEKDVRHFDTIHHLSSWKDFYFVTGPLPKLRAVWNSYGISVENTKSSVMSIHSDYFFIITPQGHLRWIVPDDPLTGVSATQSSDESELISLLLTVGA
jgi:cytochrome oxidase Cu insertion factor (SCO1/SenC/PrrC family)